MDVPQNKDVDYQPPIAETLQKIDNLDEHCLFYIFNYLDIGDFLNLADQNNSLKYDVLSYFDAPKVVKIQIMKNCSKNFHLFTDKLLIKDPRTSLQYLRNFGNTIEKLMISHFAVSKNIQDFLSGYINEYCADHLDEIVFSYCENISTFWRKPFKKVRTVRFEHCELDFKITQLNKWFPNLKKLDIGVNKVLNEDCIIMHFPYMANFEVNTDQILSVYVYR